MARHCSIALALGLLLSGPLPAQVPVYEARLERSFDAPAARQGIAVDASHFFAVDNRRIAQHDKATGALVRQWPDTPAESGLIHLDSATILDGKLYAAHSNYPQSPMQSSIEIWDAATLQRWGTHDFGVLLGSLTWIDFHDGYWWGTFGNYDQVPPGATEPYGTTAATTLVKLDAAFRVLQQWRFPPALHARFTPMSNSGGSWGPDGYLYVTGHDHPELYVLAVPADADEVQWLATVSLPGIEGQGIAWDRSAPGRLLWGINRARARVLVYEIPRVTTSAGGTTEEQEFQ
jgi:hypothetical protein